MNNVTRLVLGGLLALGCTGGLIAALASKSSVSEYLSSHYQRAPANAVPGATASSATYASSQAPLPTANAIAKAWKPAERLDQPSGTFLRYGSGVVGVVPTANGGSYVTYDNANNGYARWFPYVGGWWGTTSGGGETFRGGGPGAGK